MFSLVNNLINGIKSEEISCSNTLHLTANENVLSKLSLSFLSSSLSDRYHIGALEEHGFDSVVVRNGFVFKGLPKVYELEHAAHEAAKKMFHAGMTDFRPLSGVHAMLSVVATTTKPGDLIYALNPIHGGHFATSEIIKRLGRKVQYLPWDTENYSIDIMAFKKEISKKLPQAIILDHGAALFPLPVKMLRQIVGKEVLIIYDCSHVQGLIAGGLFQDPLTEGSNILFGNTHKTFPGPHKAMIHFQDAAYGKLISRAIGESMLSSQHTHHSIALYISILEMSKYADMYAKQVVNNANHLAKKLANYGFTVIKKNDLYTASHIILLEYKTEKECINACKKLHFNNISTNTKKIFGKNVLRIGVQEVTRLGMKEQEVDCIADIFRKILIDKIQKEIILKEVINLKKKYLNVHFSFDQDFNLWN